MNQARDREIQNRDHVSILMLILTHICEGEAGGRERLGLDPRKKNNLFAITHDQTHLDSSIHCITSLLNSVRTLKPETIQYNIYIIWTE